MTTPVFPKFSPRVGRTARLAAGFVAVSALLAVSLIGFGPAFAAPASKLIPLGAVGNQIAISPDSSTAVVTKLTTNDLIVVDVATNTIRSTVPMTAPGSVAFTPDGTQVWATGPNVVYVVNIATLAVTTISAPASSPGRITFSPSGAFAYYTDGGSNVVNAINTSALAVQNSFPIPDGSPAGIVATSTHLYVSSASGISDVLLSTGVVTLMPITGIKNDSVRLSPDLTTLYVGTTAGISTIALSTGTVSTFYTSSGVNARVGFSPDGTIAFVPHAGILTAVTIAGGVAAAQTASTLTALRAVAVAPNGKTAYATANSYTSLIVVILPTITASAAPASVAGSAYTFTVPAVGSPTPVFSLSAGNLPAGTSLNTTTGVISGVATQSGLPTFSITATNVLGSATRNYTGPTWTTSTNINSGIVGNPLAAQFTTTSPNPVTYSVSAGALPTGLILDPVTGLVSGTPTVAGIYAYTILATSDAGTASATGTALITAAAAAHYPVVSG